MIREIFQRFENLIRNGLEKLAKEGKISSGEMKKFKEQEILVEQPFRFLRGC